VRIRLGHAFDVTVRMGYELEPATGSNLRILLPQGAGGSVARINERLFSGFCRGFPQHREIGLVHKDFSSGFEKFRRFNKIQLKRHGTYCPHVQRYVLSCFSVSARGSPGQTSVLVFYRAGKPVYLRFHNHFESGSAKGFCRARVPFHELFRRIRVFERKHRYTVTNGSESVGTFPPDASCRRIVGNILRIRGLKIGKTAHQRVELSVAYFRRVLYIIEVFVPPYKGPQLLHFVARITLFRHLIRLL